MHVTLLYHWTRAPSCLTSVPPCWSCAPHLCYIHMWLLTLMSALVALAVALPLSCHRTFLPHPLSLNPLRLVACLLCLTQTQAHMGYGGVMETGQAAIRKKKEESLLCPQHAARLGHMRCHSPAFSMLSTSPIWCAAHCKTQLSSCAQMDWLG